MSEFVQVAPKKETSDRERLKLERLKFFYKEGVEPGHSIELRSHKSLFERSIEGEFFSPTTLPDGTVLNTSEEIHQYLLEPFLDKSDQRVNDVANPYWDKCNEEYLEILDGLAAEISPAIANAELVVSISARNEVDIDRAIKSFLDTNPGLSAGREVVFVVNDNFKRGDKSSGNREDVLEHLKSLSNISSNIVVTSVELPDYTNAGFAKKIGMEAILRSMGVNNHYCPIQSIDADTMGYESPGYQEQALDKLEEDGVLVVSSLYEYDPDSQTEYPAWGLRCQLMKLIDDEIAKDIYARLSGPSFLVDPVSYFLVGGYTPEFAEDRLLAEKFRDYFNLERWFGYSAYDPIRNIGRIFISPSKEFDNMRDGRLPEHHWFSAGDHSASSESLRSATSGIDGEGLLSHLKTPDSVLPAVESVYRYLLFMFGPVKKETFPDRLAAKTLCVSLVEMPELFNYINIKFLNLPIKYRGMSGTFLVKKLLSEFGDAVAFFPKIDVFKTNSFYKLIAAFRSPKN